MLLNLKGDDVATIVTAALSGGLLGKLVDWAISRGRSKANAAPALVKNAAEFQHAVSEAAKDLLRDYRDQLGFVRMRCDELQEALDHTRTELQAAREELARTTRGHSDCQAELAKLRAEIQTLVAAMPGADTESVR